MKKIKDHYFHKAKNDGYVARSAYKLEELDKRFRLLSTGKTVLDLGCFPGSWMQFIASKIGNKGMVLGIDRTQLQIHLKENMQFLQSDIFKLDLESPLLQSRFDLVCSDMAPNSTGIKDVDAERSFELCEQALEISRLKLKTKGNFVVKAFQGTTLDRLISLVRSEFYQVKSFKPKSSRNESRELFILGIGKKGRTTNTDEA